MVEDTQSPPESTTPATSSAKCQYEYGPHQREGCPNEVYRGSLCVFHSPIPSWREEDRRKEMADEEAFRQAMADKAEDFRAAFAAKEAAEDSDYEGYVFPIDADFSEATFTQDADFFGATFTQDANFSEATFTQGADFSLATFTQDADFFEATFTQGADFIEATFIQDANFFEATFTQNANFSRAAFTQGADFFGAAFIQDANFRGATFTQNANFREATFTQNANFSWAIFYQNADFFGATFTRGANFFEATFTQETRFVGTRFEGKENGTVSFDHTQFLGRGLFQKCAFGAYTHFQGTEVDKLVFRSIGPDRNPPGTMEKVSFRDAYGLERATFEAVEWGSGERRPVIWDEKEARKTDKPEDYKAARKTDKPEDYKAAEDIYRWLRRSHLERRDHPRAWQFYEGEMEMRRMRLPGARSLSIPLLKGKHISLTIPGWRRVISLPGLYWLSSGYGLRWRRALATYIVVLLAFAFFYAWGGLRVEAAGNPRAAAYEVRLMPVAEISSWDSVVEGTSRALLHSAKTSILQRDVGVEPLSDWGRWLEWLQMVLGPSSLFLIGLAVRRRFQP